MDTPKFLKKLYALKNKKQGLFFLDYTGELFSSGGTMEDFREIETQLDEGKLGEYALMCLGMQKGHFFHKELERVVGNKSDRQEEVSKEFDASVPTVKNWVACKSFPEPFVQDLVLEFIKRYEEQGEGL